METVNMTNQNEVVDEFELELQRSAALAKSGQEANSNGKIFAQLLKKACGARVHQGARR
jgi:uncharacterized protein YciW